MEVLLIIVLVFIGVLQLTSYILEIKLKKAKMNFKDRSCKEIEPKEIATFKDYQFFVDVCDEYGDHSLIESGEVTAKNDLEARLIVLDLYQGANYNLWYLKEVKK